MRGYTLVEMAVVLILLGLMFAFAVPAFRRFGNTNNLRGARQNLVAQVQMARAKAISTGVDQPIHFFYNSFGFDVHMHPAGVGVPNVGWKLPKGVIYVWPMGSPQAVTMKKDGTASNSLMIPLRNSAGAMDSVNVLTSGLVIGQ